MAESVYVLIPTHERPRLLERTLESLARCPQPEEYREAIVIENGSKSGAEKIVGAYRDALQARYLYTPRGNKSHALNQALTEIADGLIIFFDDDVRVHRGVLQAYAEAAAGVEGGMFFGGSTRVDYELEPPEWLVEYLPASATGWPEGDRPGEKTSFLGFNWAAFASDLRACGGFNPTVGPGTLSTGQETEMQQRLLAWGAAPAYVPDALVWHYVPESRCTPSWVLARGYRTGIGFGYMLWDVSTTGWAYPLWVWKGLLKRIGVLCRDGIFGDRHERFGARYRFWEYLGKMRGAKMKWGGGTSAGSVRSSKETV